MFESCWLILWSFPSCEIINMNKCGIKINVTLKRTLQKTKINFHWLFVDTLIIFCSCLIFTKKERKTTKKARNENFPITSLSSDDHRLLFTGELSFHVRAFLAQAEEDFRFAQMIWSLTLNPNQIQHEINAFYSFLCLLKLRCQRISWCGGMNFQIQGIVYIVAAN